MIRYKFEKELEELKVLVLKMTDHVKQNIDQSFHGFIDIDIEKAQQVIDADDIVDNFEKEIEKKCLNIIVREQPVAKDLRFITGVSKMIIDIERIGDHAADISKITIFLKKHKHSINFPRITKMAALCRQMLDQSVLSYLNNNMDLADATIALDLEVDALFEEVKVVIIDLLRQNAIDAEYAIYIVMIGKYLERIGDHCTNICEWVIFSISGKHKNNMLF